MSAESQNRRGESQSALAQTQDILNEASKLLNELKKSTDIHLNHLETARNALQFEPTAEKTKPNVEDLEKIVSECRTVLEALQQPKAWDVVPIARHIAKGLAVLHAAQQAARTMIKPNPPVAPSKLKPLDEDNTTPRAAMNIGEAAQRAAQSGPKSNPAAQKPVPQHIIERRAAPRAAVSAEIGFQSDTNFYTGFSEDISTGGIFLATYNLLPIGAEVNVNFTLPGGHFISVDGAVRWTREYNQLSPDVFPGMGIQFENLGKDDKDAIDAFVTQRATMFFDQE